MEEGGGGEGGEGGEGRGGGSRRRRKEEGERELESAFQHTSIIINSCFNDFKFGKLRFCHIYEFQVLLVYDFKFRIFIIPKLSSRRLILEVRLTSTYFFE